MALFICELGLGLNYRTQLLVPGHSPCPWHQATDCPNQGIPSILPDIVVFSSAHKCAHPSLAPLHIVLLLPQGQVVDGCSLDCGTPSLYKGLRDLCETHCVSSIVLDISADSRSVIGASGLGMVHGVLVLVLLWDDMF